MKRVNFTTRVREMCEELQTVLGGKPSEESVSGTVLTLYRLRDHMEKTINYDEPEPVTGDIYTYSPHNTSPTQLNIHTGGNPSHKIRCLIKFCDKLREFSLEHFRQLEKRTKELEKKKSLDVGDAYVVDLIGGRSKIMNSKKGKNPKSSPPPKPLTLSKSKPNSNAFNEFLLSADGEAKLQRVSPFSLLSESLIRYLCC